MVEELDTIADEITNLLASFEDGGNMVGLYLPTEYDAQFSGFLIEAKSIIDDELGLTSEHSFALKRVITNSRHGIGGGPSYAIVEQAAAQVRSAARSIRRKRSKVAPATTQRAYVDPSRITALQRLRAAAWDFGRLTVLCQELNTAAANRCHFATAMLLQTILNHVPPVLGLGTFAEVANNYGGSKNKSFKSAMQRLEGSLRAIADMHLHSMIRERESVPNAVQVDFSAELDVLLAEIIRVADLPATA